MFERKKKYKNTKHCVICLLVPSCFQLGPNVSKEKNKQTNTVLYAFWFLRVSIWGLMFQRKNKPKQTLLYAFWFLRDSIWGLMFERGGKKRNTKHCVIYLLVPSCFHMGPNVSNEKKKNKQNASVCVLSVISIMNSLFWFGLYHYKRVNNQTVIPQKLFYSFITC